MSFGPCRLDGAESGLIADTILSGTTDYIEQTFDDFQGYGIATPPGSPYRTMLSQAILRLQENGDLHVLKVCVYFPVLTRHLTRLLTRFPKQAALHWSLKKVLHAF